MGHKPYTKKSTPSIFQSRFPLTEEEIEDMKRIYYINGEPILALNENIAKDIYDRCYNKQYKFKHKKFQVLWRMLM